MKPILCIALILLSQLSVAQHNKTDSSGQITEVMPEFPGGQKALIAYLSKTMRYPERARESGIGGKVVTQFIVEEDGSITNITVIRSQGCGCDEEAVRVISAMPRWKPGSQNGVPVKTQFTLPFTFKLNDEEPNNKGRSEASFVGGDKELNKYLKKNVKYPDEAKQQKINGEVEVKFTVLADGKTNNYQIIKSLGHGCDEEAVRAIIAMPLWNAAYENCVAISSEKALIIHFPPK